VCTLDICSLAAPVSATAAAAVAAAAALTLIEDVLQHLYCYHIPAVSSEQQQQQCACTFYHGDSSSCFVVVHTKGVSRTAVAVASALHNVLQVSYINGGLHVHEVLSKYINKATLITVCVPPWYSIPQLITLQILCVQSFMFAASVWSCLFYC
jgi:hypothetical protein